MKEGFGKGILPRYLRYLPLCLSMAAGHAVLAQDRDTPAADREADGYRWKTVGVEMSPTEYRQAYRHNRRQILNGALAYTEDALSAVGIPEKGVKFMEGVAGLAIGKKAKLNLDESRLFAVQVDNIAEQDQSLIFRMELDW